MCCPVCFATGFQSKRLKQNLKFSIFTFQYYMYELLDDTSNRTGVSPAASCPFAIVSFSYNDTKATPFVQQERRFFSFFTFRFSHISDQNHLTFFIYLFFFFLFSEPKNQGKFHEFS